MGVSHPSGVRHVHPARCSEGFLYIVNDASIFFFLFILRRMGKNKALAHHTSTYFLTRRVSIKLSCFRSPTLAGAPLKFIASDMVPAPFACRLLGELGGDRQAS